MSTVLYDCHCHSLRSFDGRDSVLDICRSAKEKGLAGVTLTDHLDLGIYYRDGWRERFASLRADIEAAREEMGGSIKIRFGVELGQQPHDPEISKEVLERFDFDFVLGSMHNVRDSGDFYFLIDTIEKSELRRLHDRYFAEQLELVQNEDFDSLAHLTYIYRYFGHGEGIPEPTEYEELLRELFKTLAKRGKALEVNTAGTYRKKKFGISPSLWELKLYKECGGELVTLGSDSHQAENIGGGLSEGRALLLAAGFDRYAVYDKRKPLIMPL